MKARDVMTSAVTLVGPDTPIREVAKILCEHGISAVPVVGEGGVPIGMISEGDLIGRNEADREARRDWWLTLLAEGEMLNADFLASLRTPERRARDVMAAPVVTVGEETEGEQLRQMLKEELEVLSRLDQIYATKGRDRFIIALEKAKLPFELGVDRGVENNPEAVDQIHAKVLRAQERLARIE